MSVTIYDITSELVVDYRNWYDLLDDPISWLLSTLMRLFKFVDFFSNNLACVCVCVLDKDWSSINLDFVIGGIDGCGTASLHMNLEKHAETWLKIGQENCVFMKPGGFFRWETSHEASIFWD